MKVKVTVTSVYEWDEEGPLPDDWSALEVVEFLHEGTMLEGSEGRIVEESVVAEIDGRVVLTGEEVE